jgi:hypothetical protein
MSDLGFHVPNAMIAPHIAFPARIPDKIAARLKTDLTALYRPASSEQIP